MTHLRFLAIGFVFGVVMLQSGAASWFRIYEMFRFESFHMYGIIGSALALGVVVVAAIKRFGLRDVDGHAIRFADKDKTWTRYLVGGSLFGAGWALVGACPGPLFVLLGAGFAPVLVIIASAVLGTYTYGVLRERLPH